MTTECWTVAQEASCEIHVEHSRFIGHAAPATSEEEAKAFIARIRSAYADATHNCYAYRIGAGESPLTYYSDHGEPAGTAGKPILNAILQAGLSQTVVVVTRYFGGKKLGVRGLIDAYRRAAAETLKQAGRKLWVEGCEWELHLPYAAWPSVQRQIGACQGVILSCDYTETIRCRVWIPSNCQSQLRSALEASAGVSVYERPGRAGVTVPPPKFGNKIP